MTTAETHAAITAIVTRFGIAVRPGRRGGVAVLSYRYNDLSDRKGATDALRAEAARLRAAGKSVDAQSFEIASAVVRPLPNIFAAFA